MKKAFKYLLFLLICLMTTNVYALDDYSGGSSGSIGSLGSGQWTTQTVGIKVNSVSSSGRVKKSAVFLNSYGAGGNKFSTDLNPKMYQSSSITWGSIPLYSLSFLPSNWKNGSGAINNLYELLSKNNYRNLKDIAETHFHYEFGVGDYLVIEPMTAIGGKYGTAYELANYYGLTSNCSDSSSFCYNYSGAVFSGSARRTGVFYNTIYISTPVLGLTTYSSDNYTGRKNCFMSNTCGRGIGVFGYSDIYVTPPSPPSPPPTGTNVEVGCLTAKITDSNFEDNCEVSITIKNNLSGSSAIASYEFFAKTGRFIIQKRESDSKIIMFNNRYSIRNSVPRYIATATITKTCRKTNSRSSCRRPTPQYPTFSSRIPNFSFCFAKEDGNYICQDVNNQNFTSSTTRTSHTTSSDCHPISCSEPPCGCSRHNGWIASRTKTQTFTKTINFSYNLPTVYINRLTGEMYNNGSSVAGMEEGTDYIVRKGILKGLNEKEGIIDFEIIYKGRHYEPADSNKCKFETEDEIIDFPPYDPTNPTSPDLNLEFRTIDTNNPFNRNTNSNWCATSGSQPCKKNNSTVKNKIIKSPNSYGRKNGTTVDPKYTITLDVESIRYINEYYNGTVFTEFDSENKYDHNNISAATQFKEALKSEGILVEHHD